MHYRKKFTALALSIAICLHAAMPAMASWPAGAWGQAAVSGAAEEGIHDVEAGWEAQSEAGGGTEEESLWEEGVLEEEPCGTAAQAEEGAPSISLAQEGAITYTGQEIEPQLTVEYGGTMLMPGVDYETSFENNIRVGTATAHVKGIGACLFEEDFD